MYEKYEKYLYTVLQRCPHDLRSYRYLAQGADHPVQHNNTDPDPIGGVVSSRYLKILKVRLESREYPPERYVPGMVAMRSAQRYRLA